MPFALKLGLFHKGCPQLKRQFREKFASQKMFADEPEKKIAKEYFTDF